MTRKEIPDFDHRLKTANYRIQEYNLRVIHSRNDEVEMTMVYRSVRPRGDIVEIATAICHPGEQFDKGVGRTLAVERFVAGHTVQIPKFLVL